MLNIQYTHGNVQGCHCAPHKTHHRLYPRVQHCPSLKSVYHRLRQSPNGAQLHLATPSSRSDRRLHHGIQNNSLSLKIGKSRDRGRRRLRARLVALIQPSHRAAGPPGAATLRRELCGPHARRTGQKSSPQETLLRITALVSSPKHWAGRVSNETALRPLLPDLDRRNDTPARHRRKAVGFPTFVEAMVDGEVAPKADVRVPTVKSSNRPSSIVQGCEL